MVRRLVINRYKVKDWFIILFESVIDLLRLAYRLKLKLGADDIIVSDFIIINRCNLVPNVDKK